MMTEKTKHIYQKAKNDYEFREAMKSAGEECHTPKWTWCELTKTLYATAYWGYLVAKGITTKKLYKDLN